MDHRTAQDMLEQCRAMMAMMHGDGMTPMTHMAQHDRMMDMMPPGVGMLLLGMVAIALVVGVTVATVWLLGMRRGDAQAEDARRTLDLRYARGEVDRSSYLRIRADLVDGAPSAD